MAHRKIVLMVRQDLTPGSAYADVALHGDGLTSLQFRSAGGGDTQELRSPVNAPLHVRLERRGNSFTIFARKAGEELTATGPQVVNLSDPVYVGIGVCSHDANILETGVISDLAIEGGGQAAGPRYRSKVVIYDLAAKTNTTLYQQDGVVEAPNWSRDGKFLLVNTGGDLYRLPVSGAAPKLGKDRARATITAAITTRPFRGMARCWHSRLPGRRRGRRRSFWPPPMAPVRSC